MNGNDVYKIIRVNMQLINIIFNNTNTNDDNKYS